ncbi:MAG: trans-4-hydroxy-L-proline dehydratase [Anaerolineae bacterium]
MNPRITRLWHESFEAKPSISTERARIMTEFYRANKGKHSVPVMRALAFHTLCERKTIYIGPDELIVGERGPFPKATPTYPELTCHSVEDLRILGSRAKTSYAVDADAIRVYEEEIIPYWSGRSMRDRIFSRMDTEWKACYEAGIFTEFMEQRAPGHTSLDDKIYRLGCLDLKQQIANSLAKLDFLNDPLATDKREELVGMDIACDAVILFARRHAEMARTMATQETDPQRQRDLTQIAEICSWVPAHAPRSFWEALQMYWFVHLGVITELNGWDCFNPGRLDQHLYPFYAQEAEAGRLTREQAKELLQCFWIKFNNQPAPPKIGVTAAESGTYNDFANINIGGLQRDGSDAVNEVSYMLLEVVDEMHLLQPGSNIQLSRLNPDRFLDAASQVIRKGYGYPSIFNADIVVAEMVRVGKTIEDARQGGTSGCVETGCFGKEAYILTGYFNLPKVLELTLYNGLDPRTGRQIGIETGDPSSFATYEQLYAAFDRQLQHLIEIKIRGNQYIERMYATLMPAPFLSVLIDDCIAKGMDYNAGGARYNTNYIQGVGIATITDSLAAIKMHVYDEQELSLEELLRSLDSNFQQDESLRLLLANRTPRYGNDDNYADAIMQQVFQSFFSAIEGRPNTKGGEYHIDMLPTTCHIYFGSITGALPDGRKAGLPLAEGISPVQGADRHGPTAVIKSASKMDHLRTGGTLLNQKFMPQALATEKGILNLGQLVRTYFGMGGHHIQFNVVDADTLRRAQEHPAEYRDLIVRVAGYSDYFCDLGHELQDEIISRTAHEGF